MAIGEVRRAAHIGVRLETNRIQRSGQSRVDDGCQMVRKSCADTTRTCEQKLRKLMQDLSEMHGNGLWHTKCIEGIGK